MTKDKASCEICAKKVEPDALTHCRACGKKYCSKCQSPSSNQEYCKACVNMGGVVHH